MQFVVSGIVVVVAVIAAFLLPAPRAERESTPAPSPWLCGAVALIAGSLFLIVPRAWAWGAVVIYLAVDITVTFIVAGMSRRSGWAGSHRLALAAGAALAYGWHAFLQMPVDGTTGNAIRASNIVCLLIVLALIAYAARRQVRYAA
jgi:hypothetical protein